MKKVLVVDDNKENMMLMVYALRHGGYEVLQAGTGEDGVELAIREKPFFIIMDIQLPGIDGIEATRRIRNAGLTDVPIIAITSYAMRGDMDAILAAGCTAYFEKPIDPLTIVGKIHAALGLTEE
jgi:CheY-like chemotaxis protein